MLASADRTRVISSQVESMAQIRAGSYADARAMIVLMSLLSVLLVVITALGIVGMASFWVTQRTKQIGTRRALGARRTDIVREFQLENLILTAAGSLVGIALAYVVNYAFAHVAGIAKLPLVFVLIGVLVVFALGQIAIWRPAQRASRIAPAIATRSV
jgi:putative ABC transport system permease protein